MKKFLLILTGLVLLSATAQKKDVIALEPVYLVKKNKNTESKSNNTQVIVGRIYKSIEENNPVASIIKRNKAIFIREYGRGMLAGISLRGTGSSHTQVVWNGIPVNSVLNGQTDLNSLHASTYPITILKGGNSSQYGSGAIGGVLLIENPITYKKQFMLKNTLEAGSFETFSNNFNFLLSGNKFFVQVNGYISQSENDYPFVGFEIKNENGAFQNTDFETVLGYRINRKHRIYFKQKSTAIDRSMARSLYMPSKSKLIQKNHKNLGGWKYESGKFSSQTDMAYLFESYDYYFDKNSNEYSRSIGNVYIAKNRLQWSFSSKKNLQIGNEFSYQQAAGENVSLHDRKLFATYVFWEQKGKKLDYKLHLRQEFTTEYSIPLTGGIKASYHWKNLNYVQQQIRLSVSRNYRLPTFNDLYWYPGGNPHLQPEKSLNLEAEYYINNKNLNFSTNITGFYIHSTDLIKWTPETAQLWTPKNFEDVDFRGIELALYKNFHLQKKLSVDNNLEYTYQEPVNRKTGKLLPYTPAHILVNNFYIFYKKWTLNYNYRYQGKMYTTSSNTKYLPAYQIHSLSLLLNLDEHWQLQGNLNNLFNVYYESFPSHPQPGRNYQIIINYKIK